MEGLLDIFLGHEGREKLFLRCQLECEYSGGLCTEMAAEVV